MLVLDDLHAADPLPLGNAIQHLVVLDRRCWWLEPTTPMLVSPVQRAALEQLVLAGAA